jgi:hypothetical protein
MINSCNLGQAGKLDSQWVTVKKVVATVTGCIWNAPFYDSLVNPANPGGDLLPSFSQDLGQENWCCVTPAQARPTPKP